MACMNGILETISPGIIITRGKSYSRVMGSGRLTNLRHAFLVEVPVTILITRDTEVVFVSRIC